MLQPVELELPGVGALVIRAARPGEILSKDTDGATGQEQGLQGIVQQLCSQARQGLPPIVSSVYTRIKFRIFL